MQSIAKQNKDKTKRKKKKRKKKKRGEKQTKKPISLANPQI